MASTLEADLRAAREAAGISIEQIQQETRIPADVIQRFEAGRLLGDDAFNEVYLKALLRAYASAVGLSPNRVVDAYVASRKGGYAGELHPDAPPPEPVRSPVPPPEGGAGAPEGTGSPPERALAVAALARTPEPEAPPPARVTPSASAPTAANEHFPKRRVAPATAVATRRSFDRSWGTIIAATVAVVTLVAAVLWFLFRDTTPEPEETAAVPADSAAAEAAPDTAEAAPAPTPAPPLALPISLVVVAEGDGLQDFRATELPGDRRPYWVEAGNELALESGEGVVLWGEGGEGLDPAEVNLRLQGFQWDPQPGQVLRITAENGQRLLDSLQVARDGGAPVTPAPAATPPAAPAEE